MKKIEKKIFIVTNSGVFHSDEIVSIALFKILYGNLNVIRTRDEGMMASADYVINVGEVYNSKEGLYDYHQFQGDHYLYGLSSAGLVWRDVREEFKNKGYELVDIESFMEAVDARGTQVKYDSSNRFEHIFDAIGAYNDIDIVGENQYTRFMELVELMEDIIIALSRGNRQAYLDTVEVLKEMGNRNVREKNIVFAKRREFAVNLGNVIVSQFFPAWRKDSKRSNKCYIMPADTEGQYKVVTDISKRHIVAARDQVFTHINGFISIIDPKKGSTHLSITMSDGELIDVSINDINKIFDDYPEYTGVDTELL